MTATEEPTQETNGMREQLEEIIKERWKAQPKGFVISTNRVFNALGASKSHGGFRNQESDYYHIAKILKELGGEFYGKRSIGGLSKHTNNRLVGASKWQFIPKECNGP